MPSVKINPEALDWAMDEARVDDESLAARVKVSPDVVRSWRRGDASPAVGQFRKMATALRRPKSFFFATETPTGGIPASFRNPAGVTKSRDLTAEETQAVRSARRIQKIASWAAEKGGHDKLGLPSANGANEAARLSRVFISWSLDDQLGARDASEVRRLLRARLEEANIVVLHFQMGESGYRGFSLPDDRAPVIAVNTSSPAPGRAFSYLHELGHLTRRQESMCTENDTGVEAWCNNFAASFLLPKDAFLKEVDARYGDAEISDLATVTSLANRFRVSRDAVAIRLERLERAAADLYGRVRAAGASTPRRTPTGDFRSPPRHVARAREVGAAYPRLLLDAEEAGALRRHDVLGYLRVNDDQLSRMLDELHLPGAPDRMETRRTTE